MKKRKFLKVSGIAAAGAIAAPSLLSSCASGGNTDQANEDEITSSVFELPELKFDYNALEPHIDAMTMEIHHSKHHAGYVKKLNAALESSELQGLSLSDLMKKITPEQGGVRNNGGGHYNHSLYWRCMKPSTASNEAIPEDLASAINSSFDSFDNMKDKFAEAAAKHFGSGWAWICIKSENDKSMFITTTENQDNPMMSNLIENNGIPILGIDVWEHAYYLKYENNRKDYIANFMEVIDWKAVKDNFDC